MAKQNESTEWHGNYRAKVVEVDIEGNQFGAVRVFIPDLFPPEVMKIGDSGFNENAYGLIAYPANNCMGGYNTEDPDQSSAFQASMHVPLKNAWVWIWFEGGDPARPFYGNALMYRNSPVPAENVGVAYPHKVHTFCKMHSGRSIVVCDSPDQERIEIGGKKRLMFGGPAGDGASVYETQGNMTSILLDERAGKEKLLIKSHKGDYIHFDIDERNLQVSFENHVMIQINGNVDVQIKGNLTYKVDGNITAEVGGNETMKVGGNSILQAGGIVTSKSGGITALDGSVVLIQNPAARQAPSAVPVPPQGGRAT